MTDLIDRLEIAVAEWKARAEKAEFELAEVTKDRDGWIECCSAATDSDTDCNTCPLRSWEACQDICSSSSMMIAKIAELHARAEKAESKFRLMTAARDMAIKSRQKAEAERDWLADQMGVGDCGPADGCLRDEGRSCRDCWLKLADFANKLATNIISPKEAAAMCRAKLGWAPSPGLIANEALSTGRYPYLGEVKPSKTGSRLILAGINRNRWRGFLEGRPWARNAKELFGEWL